MVSDPRVTAYLSRLGGVYRDPLRVDRDASSLLKSSVGTHLQPLIAEMVENDGTTSNVLVLQGTIAMHFRGNTYQLLVDLYLPAGYPSRPPVCFVRLAPNMYLKDNHRHVGMDGKIYLPYLHEWNRHSHNLVELVVAMSSVFSADPPVFSRPPKPASASTSTSSSSNNNTSTATAGGMSSSINHRPMATSTTTTTNHNNTWVPTPPTPPPHLATGSLSASAAAPTSGTESDREAILLVEIAEANAAAEAARRAEALEAQQEAARKQAEREERQRQQALDAQKRYEQERLQQVRDQVEIKLRRYLLAQAQDCRQMLQNDLRDQQRLSLAQEQKVQRQLELYTHAKKALETQCATVAEKTRAIQAWLEEVQQQKAAASNGTDSNAAASERSIDDLVQPLNAWQAQMIDLAAENQAIADAMYFLDRALYKSGTSPSSSANTSLDCESHLRQVRKLAKRQFLLRAHLLKIGQVAMMQNPTSMASV